MPEKGKELTNLEMYEKLCTKIEESVKCKVDKEYFDKSLDVLYKVVFALFGMSTLGIVSIIITIWAK